jgi:Tfp pilus assembly protein PilF
MSENGFSQGVTLLEAGNPSAALQKFEKSLADAEGDQKADSLYNIAVCHVPTRERRSGGARHRRGRHD